MSDAGDRALADLALEVAREAAELIAEHRRGEVSVAATKTSDIDIVTEVDRAAERLIRERLAARRPDDAFLGEEGDDVAGTSGVRWVIDPIDGTVNFLYRLPQYAVSIAAEVDGEVRAGVVLNVETGTEYVGWIDECGVARSTRDGEPIAVAAAQPLATMLVATGFSYDREVRAVQAQAVMRLLPQIRDLRRLGSCALDLCHVAEGRLDAYVEEGVNLWDHAAAGLIARAAGARTELLPGAGGLTLLACAPAAAWDEFRHAVVTCGFTADNG
ncbi:inositol monophosphatase [Nocardioides sp. TRM66260-LWL]|uniref:inositol monophosphatase family protein n=1 Tax=Nocardioides sp. TRM66260-LWL TaxID=2874478 RepID=UPI001CC54A3A|nr:inositol monophosphatase family protein [Nocardioides sp. TRM66260-LWL]MBZ5733739.1 inositol monophosphatase [Nocardioides sp. TRM66260-LWL]